MDDNIGYVLKKLEDMGQLDNTIVVFTTDNGAETMTFPDGGITPFKGQKANPRKAATAHRWSSAGRGKYETMKAPTEQRDCRRSGDDHQAAGRTQNPDERPGSRSPRAAGSSTHRPNRL